MVVCFLPLSQPSILRTTCLKWADILLGMFLLRVLILIYIYENIGYNNIWFVAHLVVMILAHFGGGREKIRRRRTRYVDE